MNPTTITTATPASVAPLPPEPPGQPWAAPVASRGDAAADRIAAPGTTLARGSAIAKSAVALAKAAVAQKASTAKTVSGYAVGSAGATQAELAFLRDPKLSTEQKLLRLMALLARKLDDEIQKKMEQVAGGGAKTSTAKTSSTTASKTAAKKKGLAGFAAKVKKFLRSKPVQAFLKQVAGPVLAAGATALGFPAAAPFLLKAMPKVATALGSAADLVDTVASGAKSATASSNASSASSAPGGGSDDKLALMELQSLIDKQKEMFSLVSNMLRSIHDMRMACISNVR